MIETVLLALATLSILLCLWQWFAGWRFPLRENFDVSEARPVSVLKPLKGADSQTELCLRSWFEHDYAAECELLFGVADENDPACAIVRKLAPQFPNRLSKLVICSPILGANAKVSSLCYLAREAAHESLVISDADVEIPGGFLAEFVSRLTKGAALVNCFYIMRPLNLAMTIEAVAVNADFWTQVLQGNMLKPMDFALGAAMGTTKAQLAKIGGFEPLVDFLADDYQLGNRIARAGGRLAIATTPVTCWSDEQSPAEVWNHQLRWARTIRVCQAVPWFFSIVANATVWPLIAWAALRTDRALLLLEIALLLRGVTAKASYARLTGGNGWIAFGLAPLKDLLAAIIWALSFLGNSVVWRGRKFRVNRGGKLTPAA